MSNLMMRLWSDEAGVILSAELVLVATILVLGMLVGLVSLRDQIVSELGDIGQAFAIISQSYSFTAISGHTSATNGAYYQDGSDVCDDLSQSNPLCINVAVTPTANQAEGSNSLP